MIMTALAVGLSLGSPPARSLDLPIMGTHQGGYISLVPGLQPIVRQAVSLGSGSYVVRDLPLWVAGHWHMDLGLLADDFTKRCSADQARYRRAVFIIAVISMLYLRFM